MEQKQQSYFLRKCSSLAASGLRMGDCIEIRPLSGRVRRFALKRTEYNFVTKSGEKIEGEDVRLALPAMSPEQGRSLRIRYVKFLMGEGRDDGRYHIESPDKRPFRVNGVYTREAWLTRGHILDFAHNRMIFSARESSPGANPLDDIPEKVVSGRMSILLEGETGTGKSHLAKMIHDASGTTGNFVHLNLAAFSPTLIESELFGHVKGAFTGAVKARRGAFETAHKGTLFLDEIDSLPLEIQTKLLLVLESMLIRPLGADFARKIDTRLIFASGRPLLGLVAKGSLREDFYYRIQRGFFKRLPPLRETPLLLEKIFFNFMEKSNISACPDLLPYYKKLQWPGNIRQFVSHLEKKLLLSNGYYLAMDGEDEALENHASVRGEGEMEILTMAEVKRRYACHAFKVLEGDLNKAAKLLRVSAHTVKRMVMEKKYELLQKELPLF